MNTDEDSSTREAAKMAGSGGMNLDIGYEGGGRQKGNGEVALASKGTVQCSLDR
jgi:hypothetical protein